MAGPQKDERAERQGDPTVLITGGQGRLASAVARSFAAQGWTTLALGRQALDVTRRDDVLRVIGTARPSAVINLAAWTDVDGCERDPSAARDVNEVAVGHVAAACRDVGAHLCHISSNYVFDGASARPYNEGDAPNPLSVYGRTKLAGEAHVDPAGTVVRVGWLFGTRGRSLVGDVVKKALAADGRMEFVVDQFGSPTAADYVALALVNLTTTRTSGLYHLASQGVTSCYDLARLTVESLGGDPDRVVAVTSDHPPLRRLALRPRYSALDSTQAIDAGIAEPEPWEAAVQRFVASEFGTSQPVGAPVGLDRTGR